MKNKNNVIKSVVRITNHCKNQSDCRTCQFGTLWNGCKLMEISPAEWENEIIKDIK